MHAGSKCSPHAEAFFCRDVGAKVVRDLSELSKAKNLKKVHANLRKEHDKIQTKDDLSKELDEKAAKTIKPRRAKKRYRV